MKVLVVEDEMSLQKAVEANLIKNKVEVVTATNSADALKVLESTPDVSAIWLDHYLLGDDTGLDLLYDIRKMPQWQDLPVFAVTNSVGDDKVESYELLGIEKYFVKSNCSLKEIVTTIKETVK